MAKIGFIGLGRMGRPMSLNLLKKGHQLNVYDVVPEAVEALVKAGAKSADSLEKLIEQSEVIITMLPTSDDVKTICNADYGIFRNAKPNTLIIDCSSIEIETTRELQKLAQEKNLRMIDAPVLGGMSGAEAGTLMFLVGGTHENYEKAKPVLEGMGNDVVYAGNAGMGQAAKICNNLIMGISMIGVAEGFNLAEKLGLDLKVFFDVASHSSGECWSMTHSCPVPGLLPESPANRNYTPGFSVAMMLKDLKLAQAAGQSVKALTPLGADTMALYELLDSRGHGPKDFSIIIKMIAGKLPSESS